MMVEVLEPPQAAAAEMVNATTGGSVTKLKLKKMGRESETLLLFRPKMSLAESLMWLVFDISLTALKFLAPVAVVIVLTQNTWRYMEGMSLLQYHLNDETILALEYSLEAWLLVEVLFYLYIKYKARKLRRAKRNVTIHLLTKEQRAALVERILATVDSVEAFFEQWFSDPSVNFADLTRAHAAEIVAYCLFHRKSSSLSALELEELEDIMRQLEKALGKQIPAKSQTMSEADETALFEALMAKSAMFFTETDITYQHRPFVMYFVVEFLFQWVLSPIRMRLVGRYRAGKVNTTMFWTRRARGLKKDGGCLVFFHGIGVGLLPYSLFLSRLEKIADDRGLDLIVVEIPVISQTLSPAPLLPDSFARDIREIVQVRCGHNSAKFITHSYGSFCVNWVVNRQPQLVEGLMLIDPAAVLLHHTDILYNMLYRPEGNTSLDRVLHYIMRSELHFVHHLKREFFWFHNTMFLDQFPETCRHVSLVLSEADQVIPVKRIAEYADRTGVEYMMLEKSDHGGYLVAKQHLRAVLGRISTWLDKFHVEAESAHEK